MSEYWLCDGVYCAEASDAVVFLDMRIGRYLAFNSEGVSLDVGSTSRSRGLRNGGSVEANAENRSVLEVLSANALLTNDPALRNPYAAYLPRATSTIDCAKGSYAFRWNCMVCARFVASYVTFVITYRLTSMRRCVEILRKRQRRQKTTVANESKLTQLLCHFVRLRAMTYTSHNRCVLDTLILCDFLRRNQMSATFAIGVATRPFRAHCWAQSGSIAVNYCSEAVEAFTPLLVV